MALHQSQDCVTWIPPIRGDTTSALLRGEEIILFFDGARFYIDTADMAGGRTTSNGDRDSYNSLFSISEIPSPAGSTIDPYGAAHYKTASNL